MHETLTGLARPVPSKPDASAEGDFTPAVSVRKSLASKDMIISLIDGKPYRSLKRHLSTHGLTPEEYRARFNFKPDYPMVAEGYSQERRGMAIKLGLGQKGRAAHLGKAAQSQKAVSTGLNRSASQPPFLGRAVSEAVQHS